MENLFIDIFEITLPMSALIVLLLLCAPLIKKSYVSKWRYYMWLFVSARLIFPIKPRIKSPITMEIPSGIATHTPADTSAAGSISVMQILMLVWLLGILALTMYQIFCYVSFKKLVRRWSESVNDTNVLSAFEGAKSSLGLKNDINIKMCKAVTSPMIFGIFKPVLLLPYIPFKNDELAIILRHELVHFRRHDIWYKLLLVAARTIHWFNPVVHIMVRAANRDVELACDAEVVKNEGRRFRESYGDAIMRLVHNGSGVKTTLSTCFVFSKRMVGERIKGIFDYKIKRSGAVMFCVVAASVLISGSVVSFATERVAQEVEDNLQIVERTTPAPAEPTPEPEVNNGIASPEAEAAPQYARGGESVNTPEYDKPDDIPYTAYDMQNTTEDTQDIKDNAEDGDIYGSLGSPSEVSSDGSRETYTLQDGSTAILQYDGNELDTGYILVD